MNDIASLRRADKRSGPTILAERLAGGDARAGFLFVVMLATFYLLTAAGNLGETDDAYAFAYRAEHFSLTHLSDPRLMLYHIAMRLLFLGAQGLRLDLGALLLMRGVSAVCAAGALLMVVRILFAHFRLSAMVALLAACVLAGCYGFWRYSAEAEVYLPATLLVLLVLHGLLSLCREDEADVWRGGLSAAGWGAVGGLAVLFYQPNVVPLFLAFPLLMVRSDRIVALGSYLTAGGGVVIAGYVIGFLVYWREPLSMAGFLDFLSQRSNEFIVPPLSLRTVIVSMVRAAFALSHDVASANWIFAFDPVSGLIQRAFSYNVITEEIFLAKRAGALVYLPMVTLLLLAGLSLGILVRAWPLALARLRERPVVALIVWIAIDGAIIGRLNPAGIEAWIMLLTPLALAFAVFVAEPCLNRGAGRRVVAFAAVLFLHNAAGGMALVHDPQGEYDRVKGAWVIAEAGPRDLVLVTGNAGLAETLRYLSRAEIALINVSDVPEVADGLLHSNLSRVLTLTRGRDFSNRLLRSLIREAGSAGGRVILFDDFFKPPPRVTASDRTTIDRLQALREKATAVYDSPGAGTTYMLPPSVR